MPELSRLLTGDPILSRIITLGSIFTRAPPRIPIPSVVIIVFITTIATLRGSQWHLVWGSLIRNSSLAMLRRKLFCLYGWEDEVKNGPFSNL